MRLRMTLCFSLFLLCASAPSVSWAQYSGYSWTNSPSAAFADQARLFAQDAQILVEGIRWNGVVGGSGCQVTAQASPNMTVHVSACTISYNGSNVSVAATDKTITAADATQPRFDLVSVSGAGSVVVTTGTPGDALSLLPPAIPTTGAISNVVLALVYVPAADTAINSNQITDRRVPVLGQSPTFGGTVTAGGVTTAGTVTAATVVLSGACYTFSTLPTPSVGIVGCCSDCNGASAGTWGVCQAGGHGGPVQGVGLSGGSAALWCLSN